MEGRNASKPCHARRNPALLLTLGVCLAQGTLAFPAPPEPVRSGRGMEGSDVVLRKASSHPIRYYLSLPKDYSRQDGKRWPTLVCITGAGDDFRAAAERFRRARGDRPFLVVCPCTFSSNNLLQGRTLDRYRQLYAPEVIQGAAGDGWFPDLRARLSWDEEGLCAILADLEVDQDAAPRIHLTGFSAGGLLTYHMILNRPERLAAAVLVCANFNFWDHDGPPPRSSPEAAHVVSVTVVEGGRDPLRSYRFGGAFLPSLPLTLGLLGCAVAAVVYLLWRRKRRATAVTLAFLGLVLAGLHVVNHGAGNEVQAAAAVDLLRNSGFSRVKHCVVADLCHDPAPELGFKILTPDLLNRP